MTRNDHNKQKFSGDNGSAPGVVKTLGDLHAFVATIDLPMDVRATIRSAIKRADQIAGNGTLDFPASPDRLFAALDVYSPAMAGMSRQAFANLRSRVRKAFRLARPFLQTYRGTKLSDAWIGFREGLAEGEQRRLSRFMRFASGCGWTPAEISDEHIRHFEVHLREEAMVADWERVVRQTIKAWNLRAEGSDEAEIAMLTSPPLKRTSYWIAIDALPATLREDMDRFLQCIGQPKTFADVAAGGLKSRTVEQYRYMIITLVSAMVASGRDLASMNGLSDVVMPEHVEQALIFLHERAGNRVTAGMTTIAARARRIAAWCDAPVEVMAKFDDLVNRVRDAAPDQRGMTAKNRTLLDRLDDARFRDLVYVLPQRLWAMAGSCKRRDIAISYARSAIAIELLLTCSMRRENLVELELGKNIRRMGTGKDAAWIIEYREEDVKNEEPLRFTLPAESAAMLEAYLRDWWPLMSCVATTWLFPRPNGEPTDEKTMAHDIRRKSKRILGIPVTPHQFRHISTELYLREHPDQLDLASQHLGHRDPNTTRRYYARPHQREASRRYQQRLGLDRAEASRRIERNTRVRRTKPRSPDLGEEDML